MHHVLHCSYSLGPLSQLFNIAHKNWVVCNIKELAIGFNLSKELLANPSLMPSPSYAKREKGSGEKGHTTVSLWNAIIGILVCVK